MTLNDNTCEAYKNFFKKFEFIDKIEDNLYNSQNREIWSIIKIIENYNCYL